MARIPEAAVHLLEGRHLAHVGTVNADGSPQVTPVWVDHDGDTVLINTATGRPGRCPADRHAVPPNETAA